MKALLICVLFLFSSQLVLAQEVNIYSGRKQDLIKPILEQFTEQTGIEVNIVTGKADALIKRLELEGKNSPADILLTVDVGRLHHANEAGLLQPVNSEVLNATIPKAYRDPKNHWFGLSLRSRVIVYAKDKVSAQELSTYEDLAQSKWKGQVCIRSSNNIYNQSLVASLLAHLGPDKTAAWASDLVRNFARPPKGGDRDQIKAVAAGQCKVAVVNSYYLAGMLNSAIQSEVDAANKVALFWPNQNDRGAHMNISGAGVTTAAKNKEAAVQLLEFLVSEAAQQWYAETNHEYPVRAGTGVSTTLQQWGEYSADKLDLVVLGERNAEAVRLMDRAGWK